MSDENLQSSTIIETQHRSEERPGWNNSLIKRLTGDVVAAALSATLVAPAVTIIDR